MQSAKTQQFYLMILRGTKLGIEFKSMLSFFKNRSSAINNVIIDSVINLDYRACF